MRPIFLLSLLLSTAARASEPPTAVFEGMRARLEARRAELAGERRALLTKAEELARRLEEKVEEIRQIQAEQGRIAQNLPRPEDANQLLGADEIAAFLSASVGRCPVQPGGARDEYLFSRDGYRVRVQIAPERTVARLQSLNSAEGAPRLGILVEDTGEGGEEYSARFFYDLKARAFTEAAVSGRAEAIPAGPSLRDLVPFLRTRPGERTRLDCAN